MNGRDLLLDYQPKTRADTVYDYLRDLDSKVFKIFSEISPPTLKNLKKNISYFNEYKIEAKKNLGGFQNRNVALGANLDQYYHSEEEILTSELGKSVRAIIKLSSKEEFEDLKEEERILSQRIISYEVWYRHVDAMGSGRFFMQGKRNRNCA